MTEHPSSFALERHLLKEQDLSAHLEGCGECRETLRRLEADDRAFLIQHPSPASIGVGPKKRWWRWAAPAFALAAAVLLVVVPGPTTRTKGDSHVELLVKRARLTFPYDQRQLRPGDTLMFKYTSAHTHMLVAGLEASGQVSIFVEDARLAPGQNQLAPQGVQLDNYRGKERIFVLLSDQPLDAAAVRARLEAATIKEAPKLAPGAEQRSWVIDKEPR